MSIKRKYPVVTVLVISILILSLFAGCAIGFGAPTEEFQFELDEESGSGVGLGEQDSELGIEVIEQAWDIIFEDYVDKDKLDIEKLKQAAIEGMLEALDDPYSSYLSNDGFQATMESIEGKFEGIGAYVGMKDEHVMIIAPILDSPAERAGIKAGDIILEINGESAKGISLEEAVLRIRGPKGTEVTITILHEGDTEPVEISIIRDEVKLSSLMFDMKDEIAHIAIFHFTEQTNRELESALEKLAEANAEGIVLDLRSNPGGLLTSVVDVTSHFVEDGVLLYVVDNKGNRDTHSVNPKIDSVDLPMVVLTDNYTASAAEVMSGALQDYDRAIIAGTVTYGKGSVNLLQPLKDNSGLYITYARWYTPDEHLIEGRGITPDYELDLEGNDAVEWAINYLRENR